MVTVDPFGALSEEELEILLLFVPMLTVLDAEEIAAAAGAVLRMREGRRAEAHVRGGGNPDDLPRAERVALARRYLRNRNSWETAP